MEAKEYLLDLGFDDSHLTELFNNEDKSYYQITDLIESYHQTKLKLLGVDSVSEQRELLPGFLMKDLDGKIVTSCIGGSDVSKEWNDYLSNKT